MTSAQIVFIKNPDEDNIFIHSLTLSFLINRVNKTKFINLFKFWSTLFHLFHLIYPVQLEPLCFHAPGIINKRRNTHVSGNSYGTLIVKIEH